MCEIVDFYRGQRPDDQERLIQDVWSWDHDALEQTHDYIQWLFPLRERSGVNPRAPLICSETVAAFARDQKLRAALLRSLDLMLDFYGLARSTDPDGVPAVTPSPAFGERSPNWLRPHNHNFLRLTRILSCLRTLGLPEHATALFTSLEELCGDPRTRATVGESLRYWCSAAGAPIGLPTEPG